MDRGNSSFKPYKTFFGESIRNTFQKMKEVPESKKPELERKAIYIVQLALLSDYTERKIVSIIEE
jgi:hypothetical protein